MSPNPHLEPKHPLKAPTINATKAEHKKHAEEFLKIEQYKDPKVMNEPGYRPENDEAHS